MDFEREFRRHCASSSIKNFRIASIASTVAFAAFAIMDYIYYSSHASFVLQVSLCAFMLVAFGSTFSTELYIRLLISACVIVFVGGTVGLNMIRHDGYNFRESVPIIIIPHALHNYLHLSFIYIACTCFISQVWYSISMALYYGFYYEFITLNAFMLASSLIAVGTSYHLGKRNKMEYFQTYDQKIHVMNSCLEEAYRSKGLLLANMTHELTTPIRGICGHAQLLFDTPINESQYFHIKVMRDCSQLLLSLTDNVVQMSQMDEEIKLGEGLVNLCDVVEQAIRVAAEPASMKRIKLSSYVSPRIPDCVVGDAPKVLQILVNLLGNAIKFTSQGCIHTNLSIELEAESMYTVSLKVKDTGLGIEADAIPNLCKWFHQSPKNIPQGSAIGLILVNQLANLMGGELDVSSIHGRGSIFQVTLNFPKHYTPNQIAPGPSSPASYFQPNLELDSAEPFTHWPMREGITPLQVLVVDSSEDSCASVCSYLRDFSPRLCVDASSHLRELVEFCVVSVNNPDAAIQTLLQFRISVVIINDWLDQNFAKVFHELDSNPNLAKVQLIYACQERSAYLPKFQDLSSRSTLLRLPLRRESLLKGLFKAADSALFGTVNFIDEASRDRLQPGGTTINMDLVNYYMNTHQIEGPNTASLGNRLAAALHSPKGNITGIHDANSVCSRLDDPDNSYSHRDVSSTFSSGLVDASYSLKLNHTSTASHKDNFLDSSSDFSVTSNVYSSDVGSFALKTNNSTTSSMKDSNHRKSNDTNSLSDFNYDPLPISPLAHCDSEQIHNSI